jgi:hypothetical protein
MSEVNGFTPEIDLDQLRHEARIRRYVLRVESWPLTNGEWAFRAEYPEIPNAIAVSTSVLSAINQVDQLRDDYLARARS